MDLSHPADQDVVCFFYQSLAHIAESMCFLVWETY